MSTSGTGILENDIAYDVYTNIMAMYEKGKTIEEIEARFPLQIQDEDAYEKEMYVVANGLALWEIGAMTTNKLEYIKDIVSIGASIEEWKDSNEARLSEERKKIVNQYIKKISKKRIIKSTVKRKKGEELLIKKGDVFQYKDRNGYFRILICVEVNLVNHIAKYYFIITNYISNNEFAFDNVQHLSVLIHKYEYSGSREMAIESRPGIEKIWKLYNSNDIWIFGLIYQMVYGNSQLYNILDKFLKIGNIHFNTLYNIPGIVGGFKDINTLEMRLDDEEIEFNKKGDNIIELRHLLE